MNYLRRSAVIWATGGKTLCIARSTPFWFFPCLERRPSRSSGLRANVPMRNPADAAVRAYASALPPAEAELAEWRALPRRTSSPLSGGVGASRLQRRDRRLRGRHPRRGPSAGRATSRLGIGFQFAPAASFSVSTVIQPSGLLLGRLFHPLSVHGCRRGIRMPS